MPPSNFPPTRAKLNRLQDFATGFVSLFQGMWVTAVNLLARRKITEQYPYERRAVSPRYRGLFYLPYNQETKRLNCTGCTLCEQACPTKVISMTKLGSGKNGGVSEFNMDLGRCMFCNLCIEACPFEAIYMGPGYELASTDRNASKFDISHLAQGGAPAVEQSVRTISALLEAEAAEKAAKAAQSKPAAKDPNLTPPSAAIARTTGGENGAMPVQSPDGIIDSTEPRLAGSRNGPAEARPPGSGNGAASRQLPASGNGGTPITVAADPETESARQSSTTEATR